MNAAAHRLTAGLAVGLFMADQQRPGEDAGQNPLACGIAASVFTNLPDLLEPATSPNHRQFFHSVAFACLLGAGLVKLHRWQPDEPAEKFWKALGMLAISGYLIHLALNVTTTKSLPWMGKL